MLRHHPCRLLSCARFPSRKSMADGEIASEYEKNTGHAIVRAFEKVSYASVPAVLVANHGPFAWGPDPAAAAHNAVILEAVARMAYFTVNINPEAKPVGSGLHDKHYLEEARIQRVLRADKGKEMMPALAMFVVTQLVHLSAVDVVIIAFYFVSGPGHRLLSARTGQYRRRLLHGRARNDGVGRRAQFSLRQSGRARTDGLGGIGLSVRHSGHALVLDRRHSGDAVPGAGDDAVLLHFQNPFRPGISETAFRRTQPRAVCGFVSRS